MRNQLELASSIISSQNLSQVPTQQHSSSNNPPQSLGLQLFDSHVSITTMAQDQQET